VAGTVSSRSWRKPFDELAETELVEALRGVDQDEAVGLQAAEQVDLVQQRRVLDDQRVGLHDRLARADLAIVDPAERDDRRAHALGAEAREGLRVAALVERGDRQHLGRGDDALPATAVDANLEHPLASAAGTTANSISASSAPSAASDGGSYAASATASSKDTVAITLSSTSTGCTISSGKVSFTGAGTCVVDFNDAGNATYAAAVEVVQSIKVYAANVISVSNAPVAGGAGGSYSPGASATSGDDVVRSLASSSTGCTLSSGKVSFTGLGTCKVDFNDVGNGAFAAAKQVHRGVEQSGSSSGS
jgi:hypothetical protein